MGREIRRVPANWEHPLQDCPHSPWCGGCDQAKRNGGKCYQPLFDVPYEEAAQEWLRDCIAWANRSDYSTPEGHIKELFYWDYSGMPPDKNYYRPKWTEEPTHYQVYETVSEGTPVSPHFATKEELVEYLVAHGDFWDKIRGDGGWNRLSAERFVGCGFCPSLVAVGSEIQEPRNMTF